MKRSVPKDLFLARGMLLQGEMRALFTAAADFYQGAGKIIDAGAFAGLSAHCFGAGLAENQGNFDRHGAIHSYDKFLATEEYTRRFIETLFYTSRDQHGRILNVEHEVATGEDFLNVYWHQNQKYADMLVAHQGDFGQQSWDGTPVEILFVDVCKTKSLQDHLYRTFLPALIPGESMLIQQDYNHPWHPYIHLSMEVLKPCVDILVKSEDASRFYLYKSAPSEDLMAEALSLDYDAKQIGEAFAAIVSDAEENKKFLMHVTHVQALRTYGFHEEANAAVDDLRTQFPETHITSWAKILTPEQ